VGSLCNRAFSDSHIVLDKIILKDVLRTDFGVVGRLPTEKECELLITGDDDGGVPDELQEHFPQTHELIGTYWE